MARALKNKILNFFKKVLAISIICGIIIFATTRYCVLKRNHFVENYLIYEVRL